MVVASSLISIYMQGKVKVEFHDMAYRTYQVVSTTYGVLP